MNHKLLKIVANAALGNIPTGSDAALPEWDGPGSTIVRVQAVLYSSLSASLLAAFVAMLGKQWLNRYASVERGSVIDSGRQRKRKMDGMDTWRFGLVMECLPLMLQAALLLLGYALSNYLFSIDRVVANVVIGFTVSGLLFYFLVVSAATLSYNCPFQTPLPIILRFLIRFDSEHKKYFNRARKWFKHFSSQTTRWSRPKSGGTCGLGRYGASDKGTDRVSHMLDSNCIAWMVEMPMDMDVAMATARFIQEIVWHAGVRAVPLEKLYELLLECFDYSSGRSRSNPAFRDRAYLTAKALLHMGIQRKCIGDESESAVFRSILSRHKIMGYRRFQGDSDLESTLGIIDRVFGSFGPMDWQRFSFTIPHHIWMGHILLYRAWYVHKSGEPLPRDVKEFILHFLRLESAPPVPIIADCLFIIGLAIGIGVHIDDLSVIDKRQVDFASVLCDVKLTCCCSRGVESQIGRVHEKLAETFRNPAPTTEDIDHALLALRLIASLSKNDISLFGNDAARGSYRLFRLIMRAPVSFTYHQDKKWEASRLAMYAAYKYDRFLPPVEDPQDILYFLGHHFSLLDRGDQDQDEPIQNALHALAYASGPATIDALKGFDPTEPSFVHGVCYIFQDGRPSQLRKAALLFLPLIGDRLFNTPHPVMEPDQMRTLCMNWAAVVDCTNNSYGFRMATLAGLFGMINSHHWRPHVVMEKWELLGRFTSVPVDYQPLGMCINNLELLMDVIRNVEHPAAMATWLAILWYKYKELTPQVRERLETVTNEIAQGRRADFDLCLSVVDSELARVTGALSGLGSIGVAPGTKVDDVQQAKFSMIAFKAY